LRTIVNVGGRRGNIDVWETWCYLIGKQVIKVERIRGGGAGLCRKQEVGHFDIGIVPLAGRRYNNVLTSKVGRGRSDKGGGPGKGLCVCKTGPTKFDDRSKVVSTRHGLFCFEWGGVVYKDPS